MNILTGNDLASGDVIWWTGTGWSRDIADVVDAGSNGEAILAVEEAALRVNASYIVEAKDGIPLHIKDRIRAGGPTVRVDLGVNPDIEIVKA